MSVEATAERRGATPGEVILTVLREAAEAGDVHRPLAIGMTYEEEDIASAVRTSQCAVASDATTLYPFYEKVFERQGSFPVFEKTL